MTKLAVWKSKVKDMHQLWPPKHCFTFHTKNLPKKDGCPETALTTTSDKQTKVIQGKFLFLQSIFTLDLQVASLMQTYFYLLIKK